MCRHTDTLFNLMLNHSYCKLYPALLNYYQIYYSCYKKKNVFNFHRGLSCYFSLDFIYSPIAVICKCFRTFRFLTSFWMTLHFSAFISFLSKLLALKILLTLCWVEFLEQVSPNTCWLRISDGLLRPRQRKCLCAKDGESLALSPLDGYVCSVNEIIQNRDRHILTSNSVCVEFACFL